MVKASEIQVSVLDCVPVVYWYTGQVSNLQVRILRSKDQFKLPTRWQIKTRTKLKMHALHCCGAKSQITMPYTRDTITIGLESGKTFWEGVNRFLSIKTLASKFLKNTLSQQIKKKSLWDGSFLLIHVLLIPHVWKGNEVHSSVLSPKLLVP